MNANQLFRIHQTDRMAKKRVNTPLSGASIDQEGRSIDFTQSKGSRLFVSRCVRVCVCVWTVIDMDVAVCGI
jgi:hypothetical protein